MHKLKIEPNILKRYVFFGLGIFFLALAILGFILPVMPGLVFLVISVMFFARSSEKFHTMIIHNRFVAKHIHHYSAEGKMPLRTKIITIGIMVISLAISVTFFLLIR
jgi:uncharacterized membrane protein YbaN (DUF454 family)